MNIWWGRAVGAAMIVVALLLMQVFPGSVPWTIPGVSNPVVAFEFITNSEELLLLFGDDPELRRVLLLAMDAGNRLDLLFAGLYSLLLGICANCFLPEGQQRRICYVLAFIVFSSDLIENWALLSLSTQLQQVEPVLMFGLLPGAIESSIDDALFTWLQCATWSKWLGLAVLLLVVNQGSWKLGVLPRLSLLLAVAYAGFAFLALTDRFWVGVMSALVAPAFLLLYLRLWMPSVSDVALARV